MIEFGFEVTPWAPPEPSFFTATVILAVTSTAPLYDYCITASLLLLCTLLKSQSHCAVPGRTTPTPPLQRTYLPLQPLPHTPPKSPSHLNNPPCTHTPLSGEPSPSAACRVPENVEGAQYYAFTDTVPETKHIQAYLPQAMRLWSTSESSTCSGTTRHTELRQQHPHDWDREKS